MPEVRDTIRGFITETFMFRSNGKAIADSESLLKAGVLDSVGVLVLVQFIEETFEVKVEDEEVEPDNFASIDNLTSYVEGKIAARGAA
jgi:acyl carrier protein